MGQFSETAKDRLRAVAVPYASRSLVERHAWWSQVVYLAEVEQAMAEFARSIAHC